MHIRSITVRNYRVHRELSVSFDRTLTLIGGPNEAGKSTLAEAIHRGLFLKSGVTGTALTSIRSNVGDGAPEVELEFQKHNVVYRVHKKFNGQNGTTRLSELNGKSWQGDEAESRLSDLLEVEQIGGGRGIGDRVNQQWAHLWIWQGQSGTDPSMHATAQRESLLPRLQSGAAVVMQSELDSRVAKIFSESVTAEFTAKKEPKANSPLSRARQQFAEARRSVLSAEEQYDRLQGAADDFRKSGQQLNDAEELLTSLQTELDTTNQKRNQAKILADGFFKLHEQIERSNETIQNLRKAAGAIDDAEKELKKIQEKLQPARSMERNLADAEKAACEQHSTCEQDYEKAYTAANHSLKKFELATAAQNYFRVRGELQARLKDQFRSDEIRRELKDIENKISALPDISETRIRSLRDLSQKRGKAEATLNAIATGIDLVVADQSVRVGEKELQASSSLVITNVTEICIGSGVRLVVRPGGGDGVATAKQKLEDIDQKIQLELISIGIGSIADAEITFEERQRLARQCEKYHALLESLKADALPAEIEGLKRDQTQYVSEIERRAQMLNIDFDLPETADQVGAFMNDCTEARRNADNQADDLRTKRVQADLERAKAGKELLDHAKHVEQLGDDEKTLKGRLQGLVEANGDAEERKSQLQRIEATRDTAAREAAQLNQKLLDLQPEDIGRDIERLERAKKRQEDIKIEAKERQAVARNTLQSQGVTDPQEQLASAKAKLAEAEERLQIEERQGKAKLLLNELFRDEQQKHTTRFTQPLVTKIADYLRPVFGRSIDIQLDNENLTFTRLGLNRRNNDQGTVDFDSLSAGAREQLAAAMRLAMAELLAEGSDGCLPIVFDDAFAYSDPERVEALQAMLDLAANRGLQVIVLTCTPRDYYRLGAREVTLQPTKTLLVAASSDEAFQRTTPALLVSEPRKSDILSGSASQMGGPNTQSQRPTNPPAAADPKDAPAEIADDNSVNPDQPIPIVERTADKSGALGHGSALASMIESPTASPAYEISPAPRLDAARTDPTAILLIATLRTFGGTAKKSDLRGELGLGMEDFTSLLKVVVQAGLIREDRTRVKVSLIGD